MLLLLFVVTHALEVQETLDKIASTEFGKSYLQKIVVNDPIDKIVNNMNDFYDQLDRNLESSAKYNKEFQDECKVSITQFSTLVKELKNKERDTEITIKRRTPHFELLANRLSQKKKMRLQLDLDLERQKELRAIQKQLFEYNTDQLGIAETAVTEVRNKMVKYLSLRKNRQRKVSLLEEDDYNEEEESRQHYEKFAFIQMIVAIQRSSQGIQIEGVTQLLQGFEDICQQMHEIKEGTVMYYDIQLRYDDSEAVLNQLASQVIQICTGIMDWIAQIRRREDQAEDEKHAINQQINQLIQKQISQTNLEISSLTNEVTTISSALDQMKEALVNVKYSTETNSDLLDSKKEVCQQQNYDYTEEKKQLEEQLNVVSQLLDLFASKGGQLKKALAWMSF